MSRRGSKRVSFSPESEEANDEPIFPTHTGLSSSRHGRRRVVVGILSFGVSSSPAARRLLRRIGAGVGKTFRFVSFGKKSNNTKTTLSSSSFSCSSSSYSSSSIYLAKSKSLNESESHRAEAIEDCIEFLNSCSSMSRSNSISTWSC
ncbi:PREDICTED: josephin-like protein [Camelina sativa]|uniref:Josephin-like protein n=1 Tax=Camelina sativa TaxID=90675 RepID=A0ABM0XSZ3_CAMSA|nr:PREDICTED: josephin-like protein [Camelina sativa]